MSSNPYVDINQDTTASDFDSLLDLYQESLGQMAEAEVPFRSDTVTNGSPRERLNEWQGGARGLAQAQAAQAPIRQNFIDTAKESGMSVFEYRGDPNKPFDPQQVYISSDIPEDATMGEITAIARVLQPELLGLLPSYTGTGSGTGKFINTDEGRRFDWNQDSTLSKVTGAVGDVLPAVAYGFATAGLGNALMAGGMNPALARAGASAISSVGRTGDVGDVGDIVKNAALSAAGGAVADRVATGLEYGVNPFGEQAGMLAGQTGDLTGAYSFLNETAGATVGNLVRGQSLQDAVLGGVVQGAKEGYLPDMSDGGLDLSFETPQIIKDIGNTIVDAGKGVYEAQKPIGQAIADVAEPVYEEVIKPAGRAIDDYVIDPVVEAAQYVDDEYIDPFVSTVKEEVFDPIQEVGREIDREVLQPTKDAIVSAGEAVADAVPDVDLPDIDLPDVDWKGLFGALLAGASGMFSGGGGGGTGAPQVAQDAIQTELLDYKPFTPYRSKLSPNARLLG